MKYIREWEKMTLQLTTIIILLYAIIKIETP